MDNVKKCQKQLSRELVKFIQSYNKVAVKSFCFKEDVEYKYIIRVIGNYISKEYSKDKWLNSRIFFPIKEEYIDLSEFKGTYFEKRVEKFFDDLKNAFYSDCSESVKTYLDTDNVMDDYSKQLCMEFFNVLSELQKGVFDGIFSDCVIDVESPESVSTYKDSMKKYDAFCKAHSNKNDYEILEKFNVVLKNIVSTRQIPHLFFDDSDDV